MLFRILATTILLVGSLAIPASADAQNVSVTSVSASTDVSVVSGNWQTPGLVIHGYNHTTRSWVAFKAKVTLTHPGGAAGPIATRVTWQILNSTTGAVVGTSAPWLVTVNGGGAPAPWKLRSVSISGDLPTVPVTANPNFSGNLDFRVLVEKNTGPGIWTVQPNPMARIYRFQDNAGGGGGGGGNGGGPPDGE